MDLVEVLPNNEKHDSISKLISYRPNNNDEARNVFTSVSQPNSYSSDNSDFREPSPNGAVCPGFGNLFSRSPADTGIVCAKNCLVDISSRPNSFPVGSVNILEPKIKDSMLEVDISEVPGNSFQEDDVVVLDSSDNSVILDKHGSTSNNSHYGCISTQNFDFTEPYQITGAWKCFKDVSSKNYTRGCKWSPDGSCLLTNSDDNCLRLFNLPDCLYHEKINWDEVQEMVPALSIQENDLVYDMCWYPHMSSLDSVTCCLVSSSKCSPVHMWDAFTGELRCTYRPYNHLDEIVPAHSLAFDPTGCYLFTGFNKSIRYFDVSVPGRKFEEISTKCDRQSQNGIVSCIAFNPTSPNQFAAGSYSKTIGIYKMNRKKLMSVLEGQAGGVTHLQFSPDGTRLYSGARMDSEILCWDLRNTKQVLFSMLRMVTTNQRMYFDISKCGRYLVSGNNSGVVTIWNTSLPPKLMSGYHNAVLEPALYFTAHGDCANGISLHKTLPVLATSSGQRKFPEIVEDSDDESVFTFKEQTVDNSLRLWWAGSSNCENYETTEIVLD